MPAEDGDIRQDKLKWLVHELYQAMSLNCGDDALSRVKMKGELEW